MGAITFQITSLTIVYSPFIQAQIKENTKALRHRPLCGEFTGQFPLQKASNAENISIWLRHHVADYTDSGFGHTAGDRGQPLAVAML